MGKMKSTFKELVGRTRRLESRIVARVEDAARRWSGNPARAPLDVIQAVVADVERGIQPIGRGRRAFPFNEIRVHLAAADRQVRAQYDAVIAGPPALRDRIAERLHTAGCEVAAIDVHVAYVAKARSDWAQPEFHLEFARVDRPAPAPPPTPRFDALVASGVAEQPAYSLTETRIAIGRGVEVRDARQRLLRVNQIVFVEGGGPINDTVSRRHAHIDLDPASGRFRLFDDGSARGTSVIRGGRAVVVPSGARGLLLQPGDEIALGDARLRVKRQES
jgi:hypothetical protein